MRKSWELAMKTKLIPKSSANRLHSTLHVGGGLRLSRLWLNGKSSHRVNRNRVNGARLTSPILRRSALWGASGQSSKSFPHRVLRWFVLIHVYQFSSLAYFGDMFLKWLFNEVLFLPWVLGFFVWVWQWAVWSFGYLIWWVSHV